MHDFLEHTQRGQTALPAPHNRVVIVVRLTIAMPRQRVPGGARGKFRLAPDFDVLPASVTAAAAGVRLGEHLAQHPRVF